MPCAQCQKPLNKLNSINVFRKIHSPLPDDVNAAIRTERHSKLGRKKRNREKKGNDTNVAEDPVASVVIARLEIQLGIERKIAVPDLSLDGVIEAGGYQRSRCDRSSWCHNWSHPTVRLLGDLGRASCPTLHHQKCRFVFLSDRSRCHGYPPHTHTHDRPPLHWRKKGVIVYTRGQQYQTLATGCCFRTTLSSHANNHRLSSVTTFQSMRLTFDGTLNGINSNFEAILSTRPLGRTICGIVLFRAPIEWMTTFQAHDNKTLPVLLL